MNCKHIKVVMTRKIIISLLVGLMALPFAAGAQIKITHGPWLTDMSETGVTVMWKTPLSLMMFLTDVVG